MTSKQDKESLRRINRYRLSGGYELTTCNCKHMRRLRLGEKHSIVNPQKWLCNTCYTTESVWACLSCPNVACGRYIHEHALNHYVESGHPIVIDVNELYVYCYKCDEYVLNDNNFSDIKVLRETLLAIRYQNFTGTTRSGHTLRSASITEKEDLEMRRKLQQEQLDRDDRMFTAIWHSRFVRQRKTFRRWRKFVSIQQKKDVFHDSSTSEDEDFVLPKIIPETDDLTSSLHTTCSNVVEVVPIPLSQEASPIKSEEQTSPEKEDKLKNDEIIRSQSFENGSPATTKNINDMKQTELAPSQEENKDADIAADEEDSADITSVEIKPEKIQLNLYSRPKRSTAAKRYKELFGKKEATEPITKRSKLAIIYDAHRRSERIKTITVKKLKEDEKMKRRMKAKAKKQQKLQVKKTKAVKNTLTISKKREQLPLRNKFFTKTSKLKKYKPHKSYLSAAQSRPVTSLIPGVTGLRNLGNTCYLNSIIQVLGHLQKFRLCLLALQELDSVSSLEGKEWMTTQSSSSTSASVKGKEASKPTGRRTTIELYEAQTNDESETDFNLTRKSERLANMSMQSVRGHSDNSSFYEQKWHSLSSLSGSDPTSLCNELHDLYRVMWSGKWKMVSPYHFLQSVWSLIPSFKGYTQQDAQEFLCELLDKIVNELEHNHVKRTVAESRLALRVLDVVHTVFEGQFTSQVRCLECKYVSTTIEPFWDLSLEFPERFHRLETKKGRTRKKSSSYQQQCDLLEMLGKFTASEVLEGGKVYGCSQCNIFSETSGTKRRSSVTRKQMPVFTEAEKQLKITALPQVLRFHLKRFRWAGRNNRDKIAVHVSFPSELDMHPYCYKDGDSDDASMYVYDLSAVVIHHGRGFGAGHYTAYCWNDDGNFWVHCNDSNLELCSIEDVMASQAYILFYTQRGTDPSPHILSPPLTPVVQSPMHSTINTPERKISSESCHSDSAFCFEKSSLESLSEKIAETVPLLDQNKPT